MVRALFRLSRGGYEDLTDLCEKLEVRGYEDPTDLCEKLEYEASRKVIESPCGRPKKTETCSYFCVVHV